MTCGPSSIASRRRFTGSAMSEDDAGDIPVIDDLDCLSLRTKEALQRANLVRLTEIQAKTLQPILSGKDVIGKARTGTGKVSYIW